MPPGWREVASLRKKLEDLRELRELVRQLGRGGGKGPLKKAPEQVYSSRHPPGVIRSPMQPEETRGLTRSGERLARGWLWAASGATASGNVCTPGPPSHRRSAPNRRAATGDLSRMLPFEAHLLAAGWPRWEDAPAADEDGGDGDGTSSGGGERVLAREGSRAARMLFMARRAERQLMSYEREGWVEDEPARLTGRMEVRPAAELGPIIVCLDTSGGMGCSQVMRQCVTQQAQARRVPAGAHPAASSLAAGSMYGARETVAKAVALECMRDAHRQQRRCYLYSFRWGTAGAGWAGVVGEAEPWPHTVRLLPPWLTPSLLPAPSLHPPCACLPACLPRSGPGEVMELELGTDAASFSNLLTFLTSGFGGGTGAHGVGAGGGGGGHGGRQPGGAG